MNSHAVAAVRANMRSILVATMKSFSCSPRSLVCRDRYIAPAEADVRMMAFSFREFTNLLNKCKCSPEIAKLELRSMGELPSVVAILGLYMKDLSFLACQRKQFPATGSTGFASKSFSHVAYP